MNIVLAPALGGKTLSPITLKAENVTLRQILNLIARMEGLTWTPADGAVYISSPQDAARPVTNAVPQRAASTRPSIAAPAVQVKAEDLKKTIVAAHLGQEIPADKNVIWCASFQLAWNELMEYAGGPVEIEKGPADVVAALNRRSFDKGEIDEATVAIAVGLLADGVVDRYRDELERKFPGFTPRLPILGAIGGDFAMCATLIKQLPFEHPFEEMHVSLGKKLSMFDPAWSAREAIDSPYFKSFGIWDYQPGDKHAAAAAAQVKVLWHRFPQASEKDMLGQQFIIELQTQAKEDRLILAMVPPNKTLADTVKDVTRLMAKPNTLVSRKSLLDDELADIDPASRSRYACLLPGEVLNVPVLDFDILREFTELHGNVKAANDGLNGKFMIYATQTVRFRLNETGARIESEAVGGSIFAGPEPVERKFEFDRPFLVMLVNAHSGKPYFAAWIANDELFVREPEADPTSQTFIEPETESGSEQTVPVFVE